MQESDVTSFIRLLPTDQFADRPAGAVIDTVIIHSMFNDQGGDEYSPELCLELLNSRGVSAHYIIDRDGLVWQCVDDLKMAWHAGVSKMPRKDDGREKANSFSIGIELIGNYESGFTELQYVALTRLTELLIARHPISNIFGHSDIAPDRKTDPWNFDWSRYRSSLKPTANKIYFSGDE